MFGVFCFFREWLPSPCFLINNQKVAILNKVKNNKNNMPISKKLTNYLDKARYKYKIVEHKTTYTAWDTSQTERVKPQEVAKALVLKLDGRDPVLAVLPANRNMDKRKLLGVINAKRKKDGLKAAKKIDFAKEAWMKKNVFGKVGAVAPFRGILKFDIYADSLLLKNKEIYAGTGEYKFSVKINVKDYLKKEELIKGSFSVKKR